MDIDRTHGLAAPGAANPPEQAIARIAGGQDGMITNAQLRATGVSQDQIDRWARRGRLHRVHRGVFAVGDRPGSPRAAYRSALLAAGAGTGLFRETAAHHLRMIDEQPSEVLLVNAGRLVSRPGLIVFRRSGLDPQRDMATVDGLRCTTVARTLVDLAAVLPFSELEQAAANAEFQRKLNLKAVEAALGRAHKPVGAAHLRRLLSEGKPGAQTRFERTVLRGLLERGVPAPILQQRFRLPDGTPAHPDFYWPTARVVGEANGPHHLRPIQRAKDARRDQGFGAMGIRVVRIPMAGWRSDPDAMTAQIHQPSSSSQPHRMQTASCIWHVRPHCGHATVGTSVS